MLWKLALAMLLTQPPTWGEDEPAPERLERWEMIARSSASAAERATCTGAFASDECQPLWMGSARELLGPHLTIAIHESALSRAIHAGHCRPDQCDGGRARGPWQVHAGGRISRAAWFESAGLTAHNTDVAAWQAMRVLVASHRYCASRGHAGWQPALSLYATGRHCRLQQPKRLRTLQRLEAVLQ